MVHYYLPLATANIDAMSHPNSNPTPSPDSSAASGFSAQSQMGLPEVLQMCCLSRRSGQITFRSGESYGFIYIQHGRVLHALCGTIQGEEAIYTMLTWPGGGFSLDEDILPHKKTVTLSWEQLLFEGARRADAGMTRPKPSVATVTTAEPLTTRIQENQPKLTVTRPDLQPIIYDLQQEYTHVGRAPGNEIPLPYPSISNRHCIFVLSGSDTVLRDLNSSNGTYVNGEAISEAILRPGDLIQVGTIMIRFEPGVKRPKLLAPEQPAPEQESGYLKTQALSGALYYQSQKLPSTTPRPPKESQQPKEVKDDSIYVKGESAINYSDLARPELEKKRSAWPFIIAFILLAIIGDACYYYFFFLHHGLFPK
jgi:pSer/pThr/pTyr-binding forkhead associated (FHA) protein